jgi:hypothetical protein
MTPFFRLHRFAPLGFSTLLLAAACSDPGTGSSSRSPIADPGNESLGDVAMHLDLGMGITIKTASYNITGPNGFTKSGSIDVSHSATLSAIISGLPAGSGFNITLTATATDGTTLCVGSATFSVTPKTTSNVTVHLDCHEAPRTGSAMVNGSLNVCPVVDGVNANPAEAIVGTGIRLSGAAHDSDAGPSPLKYAWTATSGVFDDPTSPNPLFTCAATGVANITLTVSDGDSSPTCPDNLSVSVTCSDAPPVPYAWVVLGSGGTAIARVVTPDSTCPTITVNSVPQPMNVRIAAGTVAARSSSATPVKPSAFPVTACELTLPPGTTSASVLGRDLPLPKANPTKIVIIGDTGCRLKTGNPWQACSDTSQWPFAAVADAAAAQHPDLVLHVGDYHYRENSCPSNITGCQGSPWSYGWDAWEADLFRPADTLMRTAPWVMVRGNHEECLRAGQGWYRFLDTNPYSEVHSCNLAVNDNNANYNDVYAVPVGTDTQFIVFDSARSGAVTTAFDPNNPSDPVMFANYKAELQHAATLAANPNIFSIWANHHPLLGYAPVAGANPAGGQISVLSVMSTLNDGAYYPPGIGLAMHGHVHLFEGISFSTPHPPTLVSGMGGDNLDLALPDPFPLSVGPATGVTPDMIAHDNAFGFTVMERVNGSWTYKAYKIDGTLMSTCSINGSDKMTCSPQGYLH